MSETPVKRELQAGDIVFAFHGPLIYEAKILRVHRAGSATVETTTEPEAVSKFPKLTNLMDIDTYFLHYQGWNSKWDEWVGIERILEYNEENIFKKKELDQLTKRKASKPAKESSSQPSSQPNTSQSSKLSTTTSKVSKPRKKKVPTIHLKFHNSLKYILVDDWQFITRDRKLVALPSEHPVESILLDYKTFRVKMLDEAQQNVLQEILTGLQLYFDKSLSLILLYKYENLQYLQLLKKNVVNKEIVPSKVYGVEHLLRLLTSLPGLISQTEMDGVSIGVLISEMDNLLLWLADNLKQYLGKYENTSPLYDSLARS